MSCRVAMVGACPYPVPQGSQVLLRDTARALRERGHEVHLVVYGYGLGADTGSTGILAGCASGELPVHRGWVPPGVRKTSAGPSIAKPILDLALTITLRRVIREHGVDLVHAHNYEGLLVALAARKRPIIYHAHNAMADELPHYLRGAAWAARLGAGLDHALPRRADHVIAPHPRLAEYLTACGCDPRRMTVIPPLADISLFPVDSTGSAGILAGCATGLDLPPVLYMGNLDAYQNLEILYRAMERVRATLPQVRLVIATAQTGRVPGVEMIPTPDFKTLQLVLAADCVVACPRVSWSGYPIKLLNAMAAGKAVVACAGAAHPIEHERTGLVVPDNNEAAFAMALVRLLGDADLRGRLGDNARTHIAEHHNPQRIAEQIKAVYAAVSAPARGRSPVA